jgi:hypothetical protein
MKKKVKTLKKANFEALSSNKLAKLKGGNAQTPPPPSPEDPEGGLN